MPVYVDDMKAKFGRMLMCHMMADTSDELHTMANTIGVRRKWCQFEGTHKEHYDIALSKKMNAIHYGATLITQRELSLKIQEKRIARLDCSYNYGGLHAPFCNERADFRNGLIARCVTHKGNHEYTEVWVNGGWQFTPEFRNFLTNGVWTNE